MRPCMCWCVIAVVVGLIVGGIVRLADREESEDEGESWTPLMVVADTYELAHRYAREHDLGPEGRRWKYISSPERARGYRDGKYVFVSMGGRSPLSYRELIDRLDAEIVLCRAGFTRLESEDD